MTEARIDHHVWIVTACVSGGDVPASAGGAYASIIVWAASIELALQAARALCERERYSSVEITACRQVDPEDPEDGVSELLRERALWVGRTGEPVIATLHTFPGGN
jgi:hypothetical protein